MMLRIATLTALAAALALAAPKDRDWQSGTLLDAEHNAYFGTGEGGPADTVSFSDVMTSSEFHFTTLPTASNYVLDHYVIESETDVYLVERMRVRSAKPAPLVANRSVKFAVEKNKLWLAAGDGKELQTAIAKRKAKLHPTQ